MSSYDGSDSIFVVGGQDENFQSLNTMEIYNMKKNKWILQTSKLPFPLKGMQVIHAYSPEYHIYMAGGERPWRMGGTTGAIYGFHLNSYQVNNASFPSLCAL